MKRIVVGSTIVTALIVFSLLILLATGWGKAGRTMRTFSGQAPNTTAAPVDVTVPVGDLVVEAWDQSRVEVAARLDCSLLWGAACRQAADALSLRVAANDSGVVIVHFDGWPQSSNRGMRLRVTVHMPRAAAVATSTGVGQATISGLEGNVKADVGVGRVHVDMPERAAAKVDLTAGVGMASLTTASGHRQNRAPLGAQLAWSQGKGKSTVRVSCGVGRVRVRLTK
jgi:hypothetical protein